MEIKIENNLGMDVVINVGGGIVDSVADGQVITVEVEDGDVVGLEELIEEE